nr:DNA-directed DNA polymerase [Tanacetum cinerariifolium]
MELTQIDTFYNGLNENDQDSLNAAAGGNLLSKTTREALHIIENKSKVRYSRNKPNVSRMNTTYRENASKTDDRIDKRADQFSTLVEIVSKKVVTPTTVKAVEESYVTCGGNHVYYNFDATNINQSSACATTGRSFLRTGRALIDVYGEEITLRVNDEAVTFNLNQTTRYSSIYDDMSQGEVVKAKSSIKEPLNLELKDLPSHLEYAYLEGVDKLPVIIAKDLKDDEKEALLKVLKAHERVIAWKITDIKGIDPRFSTHKILMEEDYKPA